MAMRHCCCGNETLLSNETGLWQLDSVVAARLSCGPVVAMRLNCGNENQLWQ